MQTLKQNQNKQVPIANASKKFLAFIMGDERFGIDILNIQEIKSSNSLKTITKIQGAPKHIKGMTEVNGAMIPIIDLKVLSEDELKNTNPSLKQLEVVVIVSIQNKAFGLLVDAVLDILDLNDNQIKNPPDFVTNLHNYIIGVGVINDLTVIILDIEKLILSDELKISKTVV